MTEFMANINNLRLIIVATFIVSVIAMVEGVNNDQDGLVAAAAKRNSIRVCGKKLVNTLKKVCNHCYREPRLTRTAEKRSFDPESWEERRDFYERVQRLEEQPENDRMVIGGVIDRYIDKRFGHTQVSHSSNGIATKCCINQCGWTDLTAYCCKRPEASLSLD